MSMNSVLVMSKYYDFANRQQNIWLITKKNVLQQVGLSRKVGPLFVWCDNYKFTPNGRRETRCMALQFLCNPSGDILPGSVCSEETSPLIIPRLQKFVAAKLSLTKYIFSHNVTLYWTQMV